MTISNNSDIYRDVSFLLYLKQPKFNHVHWQLDVIWSEKDRWENFSQWVNQSYKPGISKLVDEWIFHMVVTNDVLGIVPFIGIMHTLLLNNRVDLRCGAGIDAFAIQTNGMIYTCPVCPEFEDFNVGSIKTQKSMNIQGSVRIQSPCLECEVFIICGGRCLFTNRHNFWGTDFSLVCETVKHLINELKRVQPIVEQMINSNKIRIDSFDYPRFNNSCEVIP